MLYVDTSILVASLTNESHTAVAQQWLASQRSGTLAISDWTIAEFSAAIAIKLRRGELSLALRNEALAIFTSVAEESLQVLAVTGLDFRTAARFADQHEAGLRAGDALHLAVAANHGAGVHTLDRQLARAGQAVGVSMTLLG